MGTDIHTRCEVDRGDGQGWRGVGAIFLSDYYDPVTDNGKSFWQPTTEQPYTGRNYTLFAVLADVRNGRGFAGVETFKPLTPISEPKGLPDDLAPNHHDPYAEEDEANEDAPHGGAVIDELSSRPAYPGYMFGDHSFSHLTLRELLAYDWDQPLHERGLISAAEYNRIRATGFKDDPQSWCGGTSGETVTQDEAEARIAAGTFPTEVGGPDMFGPTPYVEYRWTVSLRDAIGEDWFRLLDRMARWGNNYREPAVVNGTKCFHDPDKIRLVFGFDS